MRMTTKNISSTDGFKNKGRRPLFNPVTGKISRIKKNTKSAEIIEKRRTLKFTDLVPKVEEVNNQEETIKDVINEINVAKENNKEAVKHWYPRNKLVKSEIDDKVKELEEVRKRLINKRENITPPPQNEKIVEKAQKVEKVVKEPKKPKEKKQPPLHVQKGYLVAGGVPQTIIFEQDKNTLRSPGRPKGSRNKSTLMLEAIGSENAVAIYQQLVDLALGRTKEGDINACKMILDRVYPVRKACKMSIDFDGPLETVQDINEASKHLLRMVIEGEISAEDAEDIGKNFERRLRIITDSVAMDKINTTLEKVNIMTRCV